MEPRSKEAIATIHATIVSIGEMTQYEFTMDANGTRFDFRLEDYDQLNTATYIQAS